MENNDKVTYVEYIQSSTWFQIKSVCKEYKPPDGRIFETGKQKPETEFPFIRRYTSLVI